MTTLHLMSRAAPMALLAAVSACAAQGVAAPTPAPGTAAPALAPAEARIADAVIQRDHAVYEAAQARLRAVNARGRPLADYHLAKAQCWLDVSFHEYTRNDRSAFPQLALEQSSRLAALLEAAADTQALPGPWDTPLVADGARLRPDLWDRAAALRGHAGFACAAALTACAEVELAHAGHEFNQQQWRHAKPYVQMAEDRLAEADRRAAQCLPPAAPPPPPPVAPVVLPPIQPVILGAEVLFDFDRHDSAHIRPSSRAQLAALLERVQREGIRIEQVRLVGHADRLNRTGDAAYNSALSQRRVETVRELLVQAGVEPARIRTDARGDAQPLAACEGTRSRAELQECLLPDRRVDIVLEGLRAAAR